MSETRLFAPRTSTGWIGVGLGLGLLLLLVLSFFVSNAITDGGSEAAPLWLRVALPLVVLAVVVPAVVVGLRARRTDASLLGTVTVLLASFIAGWVALTEIVGLFFE